VIDEIHAFARDKRGDLLSLSLRPPPALLPGHRRVGLSATVADPDAYRSWLAPTPTSTWSGWSRAILCRAGPIDPDPENRIPWAGHSGYHAARDVMRLIEQHRMPWLLQHPRLARATFQKLWSIVTSRCRSASITAAWRSRRAARSKARWPRARSAP
jgi:ATP-dependent Lhr-like helicase